MISFYRDWCNRLSWYCFTPNDFDPFNRSEFLTYSDKISPVQRVILVHTLFYKKLNSKNWVFVSFLRWVNYIDSKMHTSNNLAPKDNLFIQAILFSSWFYLAFYQLKRKKKGQNDETERVLLCVRLFLCATICVILLPYAGMCLCISVCVCVLLVSFFCYTKRLTDYAVSTLSQNLIISCRMGLV